MLAKTYAVNNAVKNIVDQILDCDVFSLSSGFMGSDYFITQYPKVDFSELADFYVLKAELPGFEKENLEIKYENAILTLTGNRENALDDAKMLHRERFSGKFVRHFSLPKHIQSDEIKSSYKNGILSITIPKRETAKLKEIKISE